MGPLDRSHDGVGGARNHDRQAGQGTASPEFRSRAGGATTKTAMEMPSLWKPKSGSHRDLEISPRPRDSHIPTADHLFSLAQKGVDEERRRQTAPDHHKRQPP